MKNPKKPCFQSIAYVVFLMLGIVWCTVRNGSTLHALDWKKTLTYLNNGNVQCALKSTDYYIFGTNLLLLLFVCRLPIQFKQP